MADILEVTDESFESEIMQSETPAMVDFWAAWCAPCRRENPNLVKTYKHFKEKEFVNGSGFTVYGVSLDRTREEWVGAIEQDGLEWETHVSSSLSLLSRNSPRRSLAIMMPFPSIRKLDGT